MQPSPLEKIGKWYFKNDDGLAIAGWISAHYWFRNVSIMKGSQPMVISIPFSLFSNIWTFQHKLKRGLILARFVFPFKKLQSLKTIRCSHKLIRTIYLKSEPTINYLEIIGILLVFLSLIFHPKTDFVRHTCPAVCHRFLQCRAIQAWASPK